MPPDSALTSTDMGRTDMLNGAAVKPNTEMDRAAISKLEQSLRKKRKNLSMLKHPILTIQKFGALAAAWSSNALHALATHPLMVFFALPVLALWYCMEHVPNRYTETIDEWEKLVKFVVWWVGLGVLSSVGLGTGMHTGVLFLFPHIMKVCLAAEECGTLDFESRSNMWLREDDALFSCPENASAATMGDGDFGGGGGVTFWRTFWKVYPACFLWGAGTAIGEIPPYAVSYAAKLAGEHVEELDELDSLGSHREPIGQFDLMKRMKIWMIGFLQKHGFLGVFLMSAWPNMAFDLCGICCGHFLMSFWTFFGATLLGKAGVKVTLQTAFFVMLFSDHHLGNFIALIRRATPEAWGLGDLMHSALTQGKKRFHRGSGGDVAGAAAAAAAGENAAASGSGRARFGLGKKGKGGGAVGGGAAAGGDGLGAKLALVWKFVMVSFIVMFAVSCIEQFAQRRAAEEDAETIRRLKRENGITDGGNGKKEK